jgi:hypothetical protein
MADREKITDGPNERVVDELIAGTGPGIPDEALLPGQDLPTPPTDEEVAVSPPNSVRPYPESPSGPIKSEPNDGEVYRRAACAVSSPAVRSL